MYVSDDEGGNCVSSVGDADLNEDDVNCSFDPPHSTVLDDRSYTTSASSHSKTVTLSSHHNYDSIWLA